MASRSDRTVSQAGAAEDTLMFRRAVARWENEGGSDSPEVDADAAPGAAVQGGRVKLTDAELVQLQLRVIALESLVTALLADSPEKTAGLVRALAANIAPRCGSTQHHLTVRAAGQMIHLLERSKVWKAP